ncbi:Ctr copper transporter family-domain-containing protein [Chaetomium fimeti]|uniref:Copper transport protein n=1 Tax=Chaetomium fimeti TaxID=1854472 RepID=A0AAE0H872_9PEZI|nr:Ctr copper transporter family-domain-containing protein [Chaetomium fimeti]
MDMSHPATTTAPAAAATTSMGGGGMGGMGGSGCKISMLWNWYTIDSCFIASSWKITSTSVFAGSCIGVLLLVMSLELLRRSVKEYDRFLLRQHSAAPTAQKVTGSPALPAAAPGFRPTVLQQAMRALLHMVQFAVAYFVMLLAMYYNGYIIICIFIGSFLGAFVFQWEYLGVSNGQTSAAKEATVCCG